MIEEDFDDSQSYNCTDLSATKTLDPFRLMSKANLTTLLNWSLEIDLNEALNWNPPSLPANAARDDSEDEDRERLKAGLEGSTIPLRATLCQSASLADFRKEYQQDFEVGFQSGEFMTIGDYGLLLMPTYYTGVEPSFTNHTSRFEQANINYQMGFDYDICNP